MFHLCSKNILKVLIRCMVTAQLIVPLFYHMQKAGFLIYKSNFNTQLFIMNVMRCMGTSTN